MNIFTVYDTKAEAYLTPFYLKTKGLAVREITTCVNNPEHQFAKYPHDYVLFHLGTYDEDTATHHLNKAPMSMGVCVEYQETQPESQLDLLGE